MNAGACPWTSWPGHIAIAEGKTKVKPLQVYHGKVGSGLSVEDVGEKRSSPFYP